MNKRVMRRLLAGVMGLVVSLTMIFVPMQKIEAESGEGDSVPAAEVRKSDAEWKKSPTGSAGVLEGKAVLVSIFIDDKNSKWTAKAKKEANRKVKVSTAFIKKQAKKYGKNVDIVGDIYKNDGICYTYKTRKKVTDSEKSQSNLYGEIQNYIEEQLDLDGLRSMYGTDSVGFLLHLNKSGVSSTAVHYMEDGSSYFYECSTLFSKFEKKPEGASTYAHEILHLFGARDLYMLSIADQITTPFVKYMERKYPNEIMVSTYTLSGKTLKYKITNEITRVTAYYLGWKKKIPERKKYALAKVKKKGCFSLGTSLDIK